MATNSSLITKLIKETTFNLGMLGILYMQEGTTSRSCVDIEMELADSMEALPRKMIVNMVQKNPGLFMKLALEG